MKYYTFLFKKEMSEAWCVSVKLLARDDDDAVEKAIKYAERNGYCDFTLM